MKPRNKRQQQLVELSNQLPPITEEQANWGYKNCFKPIGRRTKRGIVTCMVCGQSWTDKDMNKKQCPCPSCSTKLALETTTKRVFTDYQYLCIITAIGGVQVLRFIYLHSFCKAGEKVRYFHSEVVQRWITPDGRYATFARLRPMGFHNNVWCFGSTLELRPERSLYNVEPTCTYPRWKLIPELKRSGVKKNFHGLTPFDLFYNLLTEPKAETLLKAGQHKLLYRFAYNGFHRIQDYWAAIRICIRNGYEVKDSFAWCDYIDLLRHFGKDLHNAQYVCPADLNAEHDRYVKKKREWIEKERKEEAKREALENEAAFQELKARFFGIHFTDGLIDVKVLENVEEFIQEGDAMHHCVFTNNYHLKPESLILSARINDERVETVEFSLEKWKVVQSRGVRNENTPYHEQIIGLVESNIREIQKRVTA